MKKRALISVYDKTNLLPLLDVLLQYNYEIISSGGTFQFLKDNDYEVIEISSITNFPEILEGRVKTLHPKIHAGILARRDNEQDNKALQLHQIDLIDIVIVNLYPFEQGLEQNLELAKMIELIDIGGPTLLRGAAKNYSFVTTITQIEDYQNLIEELHNHNGETSTEFRMKCSQKVFARTAQYDSFINQYLLNQTHNEYSDLPNQLNIELKQKQKLRYGENPHQQAAVYQELNHNDPFDLICSEQIQGKELSYNNLLDAQIAIKIAFSFEKSQIVCAIIKHNNPCGVALSTNCLEAYQKAFASDPQSAFGSIIAINTQIDEQTAKQITQNQFTELIIAPDFTTQAKQVFSVKKNLRLMKLVSNPNYKPNQTSISLRKIQGGILVQDEDQLSLQTQDLNIVTQIQPSQKKLEQMLFAWKVCKYVKSNAIVLCHNFQTIGIGAGQMSRIKSIEIAIEQARNFNFDLTNAVLASDAFFPFADNIEIAHKAGITAFIQTGGSLKDEEVIKKADELNCSMVLTGIRHFYH